MTKTPKWLPDGSGIDPKSLEADTVVETEYGDLTTAGEWMYPSGIVRVYADVTPPKPDPRVEVVARVLATNLGDPDDPGVFNHDARDVLAALDAMGADQ